MTTQMLDIFEDEQDFAPSFDGSGPLTGPVSFGGDSGEFGVDRVIVDAITGQESNFDDTAVSKKGALGRMQLMPATAREIAKKLGDPYDDKMLGDAYWNERWGSYYLKEGLDRYDGDIRFTAARYHAGPKVDKLYEEYKKTGVFYVPRNRSYFDGDKFTADYVDDVVARIANAKPGSARAIPRPSDSPLDIFADDMGAGGGGLDIFEDSGPVAPETPVMLRGPESFPEPVMLRGQGSFPAPQLPLQSDEPKRPIGATRSFDPLPEEPRSFGVGRDFDTEPSTARAHSAPTEKENLAMRAAKSWGRSVAGMQSGLGGAARMTHIPGVTNFGSWLKEQGDLDMEFYAVKDPNLVDGIFEGISSGLQFLVPSSGATRLAALSGKTPMVAKWLGIGLNAATEATLEMGNIYNDLKEQGVGEAEAIGRSLAGFAANVALIVASDMGSGLFKVGGGKRRLTKQIVDRSLDMSKEGLQEVGQGDITAFATGRGAERTMIDRFGEFAGGAVAAGVVGGGMDLAGKVTLFGGQQKPATTGSMEGKTFYADDAANPPLVRQVVQEAQARRDAAAVGITKIMKEGGETLPHMQETELTDVPSMIANEPSLQTILSKGSPSEQNAEIIRLTESLRDGAIVEDDDGLMYKLKTIHYKSGNVDRVWQPIYENGSDAPGRPIIISAKVDGSKKISGSVAVFADPRGNPRIKVEQDAGTRAEQPAPQAQNAETVASEVESSYTIDETAAAPKEGEYVSDLQSISQSAERLLESDRVQTPEDRAALNSAIETVRRLSGEQPATTSDQAAESGSRDGLSQEEVRDWTDDEIASVVNSYGITEDLGPDASILSFLDEYSSEEIRQIVESGTDLSGFAQPVQDMLNIERKAIEESLAAEAKFKQSSNAPDREATNLIKSTVAQARKEMSKEDVDIILNRGGVGVSAQGKQWLQAVADNWNLKEQGSNAHILFRDYMNPAGEFDFDGVATVMADVERNKNLGKKLGPRKKQRFSSETGDLFEGTGQPGEDTRRASQRKFEQEQQRRAEEARRKDKGTDGLDIFTPADAEQESLFGGSSKGSKASVGEYASRKPQPGLPGEVSGEADASGVGSKAPLHDKRHRLRKAIELPEIVEFVKSLGTKLRVVKKIRSGGGEARGAFISPAKGGGQGEIQMKAELAADLEQFTWTMAHEAGHNTDWMDGKVHARGNVLGHIASLSKYGKDFLAGDIGGVQPLNEREKRKMRESAREKLTFETEVEVDEVIRKTLPVEPREVLGILGQGDAMGAPNADLYKYLAGLSGKEKKTIAINAIRGMVPDKLQKFGRIIEERTGKRITKHTVEPSAMEVLDEYKRMFWKEVEARRLLSREVITKELWDLSRKVRPLPADASPRFIKYRKSVDELYADAFATLVVDPELLQKDAPEFWRGFFNYIDAKPEVKAVYDKIQDRIDQGDDAVQDSREQIIRKGYEKGDEAFTEKAKKRLKIPKGLGESALRQLYDKDIALALLEKEAKSYGLSGNKLRQLKDEWAYLPSEIGAYLLDIQNDVLEPMKKFGYTEKDLGLFLQLRRASTERADMANPGGVGGVHAERLLARLERRMGAHGMQELERAAKQFWKIRSEYIIPRLEQADMYTKETMDKIRDNENYVTFAFASHIDGKYGSGVSGKIFRQIGTLNDIVNPLTATVAKDMSLLRSAHKKRMLESLAKTIKEVHPSDIQESEARKVNGRNEIVHQLPGSGKQTIMYLDKGKVVAYDVPRRLAQTIEEDPVDMELFYGLVSNVSQPFKQALVQYNPFWISRNLIKDFGGTYLNLTRSTIFDMFEGYAAAIPEAWQYVYKGVQSDAIRQLRKSRALVQGRTWTAQEYVATETELDRQQINYNQLSPQRKGAMSRAWSGLLKGLEDAGQFSEVLGKLGGSKVVDKRYGELALEDRAEIVRRRVATPDIHRAGRARLLYNNVLLFSNVNMQGWAGAYESFKENPTRFAMRAMFTDVAPTVAIKTIELGLLAGLGGALGGFFKQLGEMYEKIPENDKTNYHTIPFGTTKSGKTVYFIIPKSHVGLAASGFTRKVLNTIEKPTEKNVLEALDFVKGQSPTSSLHPLLEVFGSWSSYVSGKNPRDDFTGRDIISEQKFKAGITESLPEMLKHTVESLGGSVWFKFPSDNPDKIATQFEKAYGVPIAGRLLNTFVRVSDAGLAEKYKDIGIETERKEAQRKIKVRDKIVEYIDSKDSLTKSDAARLYRELKRDGYENLTLGQFKEKFNRISMMRWGDSKSRALINAESKASREAIADEIVSKLPEAQRSREKRKLMSRAEVFREILY